MIWLGFRKSVMQETIICFLKNKTNMVTLTFN